MAYKHLFVDSDVLLDLLLYREPFYGYTQLLLIESENGQTKLSTSALAIANINYILGRKIGTAAAKENIKKLLKIINVLSFENDIIDHALATNFSDLEDAMQYLIAKRYDCGTIITRNIKDYKHASIPVMTAEQFLKTL